MDSKWWEPAIRKENSQEQPSLLKAYTVVIEQSIKKALKKVDFNSRHSVNVSGSGGGLSTKSNTTCHKFGKKGHLNKDYRSKVNGSVGNPPKKSVNELP